MKLVLLGAPGAGKGTQAEILSKKLGIPCISTGEILRAAIKNATPIGLKVKEFMDSGALVPDDIVIEITNERVARDDCREGYILDGIPRTIAQADTLERQGIQIDIALSIEISDAEIETRIAGRRYCSVCGATYHTVSKPPKAAGVCDKCGAALTTRHDDEPETVKSRLATYHRDTEPLKEFYALRGRLRLVENITGVEAMAAEIFKTLGIAND